MPKVKVRFNDEKGVRYSFLDSKFATSAAVVAMGGTIVPELSKAAPKHFDPIETKPRKTRGPNKKKAAHAS